MSRLETETRNAINSYYNTKINHKKDELTILKTKLKNKEIDNFCKDEDVVKCKELINKIVLKYSEYYINHNLEIYEYRTDFNFEKSKDYQKLTKEIEKLENEKRNLLITLENNNKNTDIYKKELAKFMKKLT